MSEAVIHGARHDLHNLPTPTPRKQILVNLWVSGIELPTHCTSGQCVNHYSFIHSFIHSGYFYSSSSKSTTTQRRSQHSTDTVSESNAKANRQQATAN